MRVPGRRRTPARIGAFVATWWGLPLVHAAEIRLDGCSQVDEAALSELVDAEFAALMEAPEQVELLCGPDGSRLQVVWRGGRRRVRALPAPPPSPRALALAAGQLARAGPVSPSPEPEPGPEPEPDGARIETAVSALVAGRGRVALRYAALGRFSAAGLDPGALMGGARLGLGLGRAGWWLTAGVEGDAGTVASNDVNAWGVGGFVSGGAELGNSTVRVLPEVGLAIRYERVELSQAEPNAPRPEADLALLEPFVAVGLAFDVGPIQIGPHVQLGTPLPTPRIRIDASPAEDPVDLGPVRLRVGLRIGGSTGAGP